MKQFVFGLAITVLFEASVIGMIGLFVTLQMRWFSEALSNTLFAGMMTGLALGVIAAAVFVVVAT